ncbi:hypothetical protein BABINDRAFT_35738 [Babjeviella inositovora NRRL Y-12698]|uniref:Phosphatidic acid phosphatase type 2/haloperoxidase domain-containing protein n=1 Tax=Babjeviella inositovora NRRL Y-12698 TaxID=984486 RepID=A0A1E3QTA4_9ASCO|nr:uncharacterized protein BABINDRAFT_35738 [Babjeviella inositovora NRRL Y-12698]ODQ80242.1 hypothetical protein BABINDRAFT_35738 [Babjeviella inositovora NRRL Y-12698]
MIQLYLSTPQFKAQIPNWALAFTVAAAFLVAETATPYAREFLLVDPTINHPFTYDERITGPFCLFLVSLIPFAVITACVFVPFQKGIVSNHSKLHLYHVSLLALVIVLSMNGLATDLLKNWIGRPRPDFLARCGAQKMSLEAMSLKFYTAEICTAPLGAAVLEDGFRSCPSGHTSFAFAGLGFLALWCGFQWQVLRTDVLVWRVFVGCIAPIMGAFYIGISRILDYRHHFEDIMFGMLVGLAISVTVFFKFRLVLCTPGSEEEIAKPVLPL